jgi:FkbM family methyltransferase
MPKTIELEGTPFWVLSGDKNLTPRAIEAKTICIEKELFNLEVVKNLCPGDVVVDVGAFIGDTARHFLDKGCIVFAFEPMPDAFACLIHNCPEAMCVNAAAGDGRPVACFNNPINGNLGTRSVRLNPDGEISVRVDELPLDGLKFLKIDCEGFEPFVLDGAIESIKKYQPAILVEAYDTMLAQNGFARSDILKRLFKLGYSVHVAIGFEEDDRLDYLAIPSGH